MLTFILAKWMVTPMAIKASNSLPHHIGTKKTAELPMVSHGVASGMILSRSGIPLLLGQIGPRPK
jgi:hypothetical protein